ncbi:GGDEF domain-containing protein [Catenovulum sp. 2E275]|uniref:GGDEF domain-containing protein n=1 Tax=Catenovulum sp. 2E275 TaxID=2980497 RepID=UPI0021CE1020|nr:GGDEF domain-containing protein [Catenovulum sp. 2E275]
MHSILLPAYAADSVKLQLRWLHQFQFAGYYMAKEKGFYAEENIDVELIEGGPNALSPIESVLKGEVDFAITGSGVVIERMEGKPVVALAAIMQTSPIVWITLKKDKINTPQDIIGHTVLIMPPPESAELLIMLEREGLSSSTLNIQPTSFDINDLISGKAQAYDGYISNEPYYLEQQGIEYNIINPKDYGINFYSDVLITSEQQATEQANLTMRFKKASLKGWEYALNHIDETIQLIHQKYAPQKTLAHLRFEARTIKELVIPELVQLGHMNPGRWQFIAQSYQQLNMTQAEVNLDGFLFTEKTKTDYLLAAKIGGFASLLLAIAAFIIYKFKKLSVQLAQSNQRLSQQAVTDQLTQLNNRRGLEDNARRVLNLAQREGFPCCFIMLDIDHFKAVNDNYGHQAGDQALVTFAKTISQYRRKHDVIARVGGEEFAILLVNSDLIQSHQLALQIQQDINNLMITIPKTTDTFKITASMGIAEASGDLESFWMIADKALYQAKHAGRNTLVVAQN